MSLDPAVKAVLAQRKNAVAVFKRSSCIRTVGTRALEPLGQLCQAGDANLGQLWADLKCRLESYNLGCLVPLVLRGSSGAVYGNKGDILRSS